MSDRHARAEARTYDASSIQVLEGLEPVRYRPGMYLGPLDEPAALEQVLEGPLGALAAFIGPDDDPRVVMTLHDGRRVTVEAAGSKFPVADGPAAQQLVTVLHGHWRYWPDGLDGPDGVHLPVANAVSWVFEVDVFREGRSHRLRCRRGRVELALHDAGPTHRSGTRIRFTLDDEIFPRTVGFDLEGAGRAADRVALWKAGLRIHILDEATSRTAEVFLGPEDLLRRMTLAGTPIVGVVDVRGHPLRYAAGRVLEPDVIVQGLPMNAFAEALSELLPDGVGFVLHDVASVCIDPVELHDAIGPRLARAGLV